MKGGQTTIVIDIHQSYPRAYVHCHTNLQTTKTRPPGFGQQGPAEVVWLTEQIDAMIDRMTPLKADTNTVEVKDRSIGDASYTVPKKKLFPHPPHFTADNDFSGKHVMDYL